MNWNEVNKLDCVEGLKSIEADSIDCIIADPPYNIGKDFGNNKTQQAIKEYADWCDTWIAECERILSPSGTLYVYGFSEILAHLSVRMNLPHRWLAWHYTNKTVPSLHFWQRSLHGRLCKRLF